MFGLATGEMQMSMRKPGLIEAEDVHTEGDSSSWPSTSQKK